MIVRPGIVTNWELMEEQVQFYRDHLDIFIEDQFPPIRLTRDQHIIAREFGRRSDMKVVCSRGFGKTWLTALCCHAMCVLYPGTLVAVCSITAPQATLVLGKLKMLAEQNPNIAAELVCGSARNLVQISGEKGKCSYKNTSQIESYALSQMRGLRAKIVVVDESPGVNQDDLDAIVSPLKNYRREISFNYEFKDFASKSIAITSACEKQNSFYKDFLRVTRDMAQGKPSAFSCVFNYEAAIANGITEKEYFDGEREKLPTSVFEMEYNSIFIGSISNSAFPYDLTQGCRTLAKIELEQPKNSKSRYVISLDIATSDADTADNAIITTVKYTERSDGSFAKKLVYIRSFHGNSLDILANEMRKVYHLQFPNAERLIYDARGLGDSFSKFMDEPWIDPSTGKEYPPLVDDDSEVYIASAVPILHPVRAVQTLNARMATTLRVVLEKRSLEIPMNSRVVQANNTNAENPIPMKAEELAVFMEADALQFEMGNICQKVSASGNYIYDTPRNSLHKDRYSSLAMAIDYIAQLEEVSINKHKRGPVCVALVSNY